MMINEDFHGKRAGCDIREVGDMVSRRALLQPLSLWSRSLHLLYWVLHARILLTRVALLRHTDANKLPVTRLTLDWFPHECWRKVSDNARFRTEFLVKRGLNFFPFEISLIQYFWRIAPERTGRQRPIACENSTFAGSDVCKMGDMVSRRALLLLRSANSRFASTGRKLTRPFLGPSRSDTSMHANTGCLA